MRSAGGTVRTACDRIDPGLGTVRTPNADAGHVTAAVSHDHAAVHSQLAKVLGSSHFRTSKRSETLLQLIGDILHFYFFAS